MTADDDPTTPDAGAPDPAMPPPTGDSGASGHDPAGAASPHPSPGEPRRLLRSTGPDRVLAGVCAGIARYANVDPIIVRIVAIALVLFGGAGILLYVAAALLVPTDDQADERPHRGLAVAGVIALVIAIGILLPDPGWGRHWGWGSFVVPLTLLGLIGLAVWWLASGERPPGSPRDVLRRAGLGLVLLAACGILALGGAWAGATGGGTGVALAAIAVGLALIAGAFVGGARWLVLPALALVLPAGAVAATDLDLDGGVGHREHRPTTVADVRPAYRLGVGELVVDLRGVDLAPGDHPLRLDLGIGSATLLVADDVCVATRSHVGVGASMVLDHENGGVDVAYEELPTAPAGTARIVLDSDISVGALQVSHHTRGDDRHLDRDERGTNAACDGGA